MVALPIGKYSLTMMRCMKSMASGARLRKGSEVMKTVLSCALVLMVLAGVSLASDLPEAPSSVMAANAAIEIIAPAPLREPATIRTEGKVIDSKFIALALISTGSTFSDSYTTLFARENWLAGKTNVCNAEVQSPYLYGTHPTVARAYAVASVKSAGAIAASYYLRKHHSKFWSFPLITSSVLSLQGTTHNMIACN
jgi:hypothetical protein